MSFGKLSKLLLHVLMSIAKSIIEFLHGSHNLLEFLILVHQLKGLVGRLLKFFDQSKPIFTNLKQILLTLLIPLHYLRTFFQYTISFIFASLLLIYDVFDLMI